MNLKKELKGYPTFILIKGSFFTKKNEYKLVYLNENRPELKKQ